MPIHADSKHRYPKDWPAVAQAIKERAGGRCECTGECGLHKSHRCIELHGDPAIYAKGYVVLTVAHLDHTPENCDPSNLKAMCQRCHLRYDSAHHAENRRRRKRKAAEDAGQLTIDKKDA